MDNYRRETTDYEPNFVMRDPEPEEIQQGKIPSEEIHQQTAYGSPQKAEPQSYSQQPASQRNAHEDSQAYQTQGAFRDPRENFRNHRPQPQNDYTAYNYGSESPETCSSTETGSRPQFIAAERAKKEKKSKKPSQPVNLTKKSLALLIVLCVIVSTAFGFGGAALGSFVFDDDSTPAKKASVSGDGYTLENATGSSLTIQEITEATKVSVVEIKTESVSSDAWMQQYVTEGAGSGVIITSDGYIVTNNHVIEGASKIAVTTADGKEYEAELIGTDSNTDVAVLKIKAKDLTPATYGNSDQLAVGDLAVAIGNPLGELGGTVTAGIISALDRQLALDGKTMTLLQTDSSINPGNSGGGLFNDDGHLIGIVVAKSSGSDVEGLGFAIPINTAADVAQQLMDKGYVSGQPFTGMSYAENGSTVYIYSVDGENAKAAGFQSGDQVYAVDGQEITSFDSLSSIITSHKVGDKITYTVLRNGRAIDISFELEEKKAE